MLYSDCPCSYEDTVATFPQGTCCVGEDTIATFPQSTCSAGECQPKRPSRPPFNKPAEAGNRLSEGDEDSDAKDGGRGAVPYRQADTGTSSRTWSPHSVNASKHVRKQGLYGQCRGPRSVSFLSCWGSLFFAVMVSSGSAVLSTPACCWSRSHRSERARRPARRG